MTTTDMQAPTEAEILAAARALANHNADTCNVNRDDNWMIYGDSFRESAEIALRAALASRPDAQADERGANPNRASDEPGGQECTKCGRIFIGGPEHDVCGICAAAAQATAQADERGAFQSRVHPWMLACFGAEIAADRAERNHRFFEEAAELVQACGMTASEAHQLVDYTWSRPIGEKTQEVGGVMVTLAALCLANGLDMHAAGETELARISDPETMAKIRAKQAAKPKHSPLPEARAAAPQAEAAQGVAEGWVKLAEHAKSLRGLYFNTNLCPEGFRNAVECLSDEATKLLAAAPSPDREQVGEMPECCGTPAYCSSVRRCTANDASPSHECGERNQCDGCNVGAPLTERGNHAMPDGGFMGCTKDRYEGGERQGAALSDDLAMQIFEAAHRHAFFEFKRKAIAILAASAPTLGDESIPKVRVIFEHTESGTRITRETTAMRVERRDDGSLVTYIPMEFGNATAPAVAPLTDEQILNIAEDFKSSHMSCGVLMDSFDSIGFARALLANGE